MKTAFALATSGVWALALIGGVAFGANPVLSVDPLTQLPIDPASDLKMGLGNAPTKLPEITICKSKVMTDSYSVYSTVDVTIAWYQAHLTGFSHAHGYSGGRSRDQFYNSTGTIVVTVTGEPGADGAKVDTHNVDYYTFNPGASEKTILAALKGQVVCS
jgi:hypothetical protein